MSSFILYSLFDVGWIKWRISKPPDPRNFVCDSFQSCSAFLCLGVMLQSYLRPTSKTHTVPQFTLRKNMARELYTYKRYKVEYRLSNCQLLNVLKTQRDMLRQAYSRLRPCTPALIYCGIVFLILIVSFSLTV